MNRILKSALVVVAFTAGTAFAQDSDSQVVTGNVGDSISITAPSDDTINLTPDGTNTLMANLTVSATKGFTIKAKSDVAKMAEHDGATYVESGKTLATVPSIDATIASGSYEGTEILGTPLLTTDTVIFNGDEAIQEQTVTSTITQPVLHTDSVLATNVYRMEVTYTATLNP